MDIVERLRKSANKVYSQDGYTFRLGLQNEAADEIERLRKLVFEAFCEGFQEGKDGGWIVGANSEPWRGSHSRTALKEEK